MKRQSDNFSKIYLLEMVITIICTKRLQFSKYFEKVRNSRDFFAKKEKIMEEFYFIFNSNLTSLNWTVMKLWNIPQIAFFENLWVYFYFVYCHMLLICVVFRNFGVVKWKTTKCFRWIFTISQGLNTKKGATVPDVLLCRFIKQSKLKQLLDE